MAKSSHLEHANASKKNILAELDRAEEKYQELLLTCKEDIFINAFQYATIGMALVSPDGNWVKVNNALCQIVGYTESVKSP